MLAVLAEAALRTVLLAAFVRLGLWLLRIERAKLLLAAWTVTLAASLAMPALQWATPLRLAVLPDLSSMMQAGADDAPLHVSAPAMPGPALDAEAREPAGGSWLEAGYLLVSGLLLLRLTVGLALSLWLLGKATPIRMDGAKDGRVRISGHVAAPVTVANVILLPADAVDWPATKRRAVLAHEYAHVARWDFALLLLSQAYRAVFWFSPLSWWLHRRLAALAELASDDHAMEVTGDRPGYAEILLEMGRRSGPILRGLPMARPATVRYRIERILSERAGAHPTNPFQQMMVAAGAAGLSIVAASSGLYSTPPTELAGRTGQLAPPTPADIAASLQAVADLPRPISSPQVGGELAAAAPQGAVPPVVASLATVLSRSRPIRAMPRPAPKLAARISASTQPSHAARHASPAGNAPLAEASPDDQLAHSASVPPPVAADEAARGSGQGALSHGDGAMRPVLRLINDRTCTGVYQPQYAATIVDGGLNLVRAKLFRDASGTPWLTFFSGGQAPVIQPVTVTQGQDSPTTSPSTVFTIVPRSARHLNGFIKRPYGTIDFDCGGSDAHLLMEGS